MRTECSLSDIFSDEKDKIQFLCAKNSCCEKTFDKYHDTDGKKSIINNMDTIRAGDDTVQQDVEMIPTVSQPTTKIDAVIDIYMSMEICAYMEPIDQLKFKLSDRIIDKLVKINPKKAVFDGYKIHIVD